jgi:hypothetical protein
MAVTGRLNFRLGAPNYLEINQLFLRKFEFPDNNSARPFIHRE